MEEESGARLVNPWIIGKKRTFTVMGTFFLCATIFFQVSFSGFVNGKNCWCANCSCIRQLYEMKGVTFVVTREIHWNRNVDEICVLVGHCSGCPPLEVTGKT
jgi:hypothetical protein